jgi:hypothetical protein
MEIAMDSEAVAFASESPRPQYHFGIGAELQREPGLVSRVISVCAIMCSIRGVQSSLHTHVSAQLHINGPAFRSHTIDIGDTILEIDGASSWGGVSACQFAHCHLRCQSCLQSR